MELIPCSRIGHLYRRSTYSFNGNETEIAAQNAIRLVEVWMSDLKYLYYAVNPGKSFAYQNWQSPPAGKRNSFQLTSDYQPVI